ncbi:MAG: DUF932 domain-containing protein [Nitrososphaerota archaeon]
MSTMLTTPSVSIPKTQVLLDRPAWQMLGATKSATFRSSADLMQEAGLAWTVEEYPVAFKTSHGMEREIKHKKALVRSDTKEVLSIVSKKYSVLQNIDAFSFVDQLRNDYGLEYENALSLGKNIVLITRAPGQDEIVDGDFCYRYLVFSNSHGGYAIKIFPTSIRVICINTFLAAYSTARKSNTLFTVRHTGQLKEKLHNARLSIEASSEKFSTFLTIARKLAAKKLADEQFKVFVNKLIPVPRKENGENKSKSRNERYQDAINFLFYEDPKQNQFNINKTGWAAFAAVTEFVDYRKRRGKTPEKEAVTRANDIFFGSGSLLKNKALNILADLVGFTTEEKQLVKSIT